MTIATTLAEAAVMRASDESRYAAQARSSRPSERRMAETTDAPASVRVALETATVTRATKDDGSETATVVGFASVTEQGYEMYDWAGPYTEVVDMGAFDVTLGTSPLVEFTLNHGAGGGLPMAHTRNETLALSVIREGETTGLWYEADVDPTRSDVADMLKALERGDLAEASFKFRIVRGQWSPDYTEFRIAETDLHRGDVSSVNFGANPLATSGVRSAPAAPERRAPHDVVPDDELRHRRARRV